jgi:chaperonin GroES
MDIRPLADRVVIEPLPAETKTAAGIFIPETFKEKPQKGIVVAVGPGLKDQPAACKTGNMVLFGKYAGAEISVNGKDCLIMRESDIFAIINE